MFDKIIYKLKNKPSSGLYIALAASLILLFASLFSLCILQSDDYYYSAFFKNGLGEFFRLTAEHFQTVNGRALVHFFLQITLALPKLFLILINSAILFSIGFFSFKISRLHESSNHGILYLIMFYSFIMLSGTNTLKESIMWTSGFYNYAFPAFITLASLYLCQKHNPLGYLLCFFAGATTEQWGISAVVMLTAYLMQSARNSKERKNPARYLPSLSALLGYITIFTSPATVSRIFVSGHTSLTASLFDISRLAQAFFTKGSCVAIIVIFILVTSLTAIIKKGIFSVLYSGFLPLALIVLLPFHNSYMAVLLVFLCYLLMCAALFYKEKHPAATLLFGALTAIVIMLPTNTFDARITFPGALLLSLSAISIFLDLKIDKKVSSVASLALLAAAVVAFAPSYMGFYRNSLMEKHNLKAIEEAKQTKILNYCIDYDKTYTVRQMFNDGWFYNAFLSLYDLEDCTVYIDSANAKPLYYNGKALKSKALISDGEAYVPMRAFIDEAGGTINESGTLFTLNGKSLTYIDGIFMYTSPEGHKKYLNADNNKLLDFYALYIKLDVVSEVFNVTLTVK